MFLHGPLHRTQPNATCTSLYSVDCRTILQLIMLLLNENRSCHEMYKGVNYRSLSRSPNQNGWRHVLSNHMLYGTRDQITSEWATRRIYSGLFVNTRPTNQITPPRSTPALSSNPNAMTLRAPSERLRVTRSSQASASSVTLRADTMPL